MMTMRVDALSLMMLSRPVCSSLLSPLMMVAATRTFEGMISSENRRERRERGNETTFKTAGRQEEKGRRLSKAAAAGRKRKRPVIAETQQVGGRQCSCP